MAGRIPLRSVEVGVPFAYFKMELNQKVKIKNWEYIQSHADPVNPVPAMEPWCGKNVTIADCIVPKLAEDLPAIYSILEDEGKFMWSQDWLENVEE